MQDNNQKSKLTIIRNKSNFNQKLKNQSDKYQNMKSLINSSLNAYGLTLTFISNELYREKYPDYIIYSDQKYGIEIYQQEKLRYEIANKLLSVMRKTLNIFSSNIINESNNIQRYNKQLMIPIHYFRMELMDRYERLKSIQKTRGSYNILPLHYHSLMFAKPELVENINEYIGDDKLKPLHPMIQSSRLEPLISENKKLDYCGYIEKSNSSASYFYLPYGGYYPNAFDNNPAQFIQDLKLSA